MDRDRSPVGRESFVQQWLFNADNQIENGTSVSTHQSKDGDRSSNRPGRDAPREGRSRIKDRSSRRSQTAALRLDVNSNGMHGSRASMGHRLKEYWRIDHPLHLMQSSMFDAELLPNHLRHQPPLNRDRANDGVRESFRGAHPENRRKRRRATSSNTSLLELGFTRSPIIDKAPGANRSDRRQTREKDQASPALDGVGGASVMGTSIFSSPLLSQSRRVEETFHRRPRNKTREDHYELNDQSVKTAKPKRKPRRTSRRRQRNDARALPHEFSSTNVTNNRLTLNATASLGLFQKGRASNIMRNSGVPDLAFSEMRFLRNSPKRHEDPPEVPAKGKRRSQRVRDDALQNEITQFFDSTKKALMEIHPNVESRRVCSSREKQSGLKFRAQTRALSSVKTSEPASPFESAESLRKSFPENVVRITRPCTKSKADSADAGDCFSDLNEERGPKKLNRCNSSQSPSPLPPRRNAIEQNFDRERNPTTTSSHKQAIAASRPCGGLNKSHEHHTGASSTAFSPQIGIHDPMNELIRPLPADKSAGAPDGGVAKGRPHPTEALVDPKMIRSRTPSAPSSVDYQQKTPLPEGHRVTLEPVCHSRKTKGFQRGREQCYDASTLILSDERTRLLDSLLAVCEESFERRLRKANSSSGLAQAQVIEEATTDGLVHSGRPLTSSKCLHEVPENATPALGSQQREPRSIERESPHARPVLEATANHKHQGIACFDTEEHSMSRPVQNPLHIADWPTHTPLLHPSAQGSIPRPGSPSTSPSARNSPYKENDIHLSATSHSHRPSENEAGDFAVKYCPQSALSMPNRHSSFQTRSYPPRREFGDVDNTEPGESFAPPANSFQHRITHDDVMLFPQDQRWPHENLNVEVHDDGRSEYTNDLTLFDHIDEADDDITDAGDGSLRHQRRPESARISHRGEHESVRSVPARDEDRMAGFWRPHMLY